MAQHERLGLLGGTFDPPHLGHLHAAIGAIERLGLDRVVLVPARQQPLKSATVTADAAHRRAMCLHLAECHPQLAMDPIELDRDGLSFSVETVRAYRAARPTAELVFLVGEDAAATLPQWREPQALASLARIVVLTRGETPVRLDVGLPLERLATRRVDISATEIRARVRAGKSICGFVPDAVATYIATHGLYGPTTE